MFNKRTFITIFVLIVIYLVLNYKQEIQRNQKYSIIDLLNQNSKFNYFTHETIASNIQLKSSQNSNKCTMKKCFNFLKCNLTNFKLYIYDEPTLITSNIYKNIINSLSNSLYRTKDPNEACLYVSSIDTLDRDKLSKNYVKNLRRLMPKLKYWNQTGSNHLVFNLYSGSWPNYTNSLEFDSYNAILVKASFSIQHYRRNFDVSFPLFHSDLPFNETFNSTLQFQSLNTNKKYLLTFKGKRYLSGYGSDTRNSLFLLNNDRDVILLTTCKHGYNWEEFKDDRCDIDNAIYDNYNYTELLYNSKFCLIPRGRRLATYRFLESIKVGCIPVILSNGWVLPFYEIIDWNKCVIQADERLITHIPSHLREISTERIEKMRKQCLIYYEKYFASIEKIVLTSIEIIKSRIFKDVLIS